MRLEPKERSDGKVVELRYDGDDERGEQDACGDQRWDQARLAQDAAERGGENEPRVELQWAVVGLHCVRRWENLEIRGDDGGDGVGGDDGEIEVEHGDGKCNHQTAAPGTVTW